MCSSLAATLTPAQESVYVCYALACWLASLLRPEGMLHEPCQALHSLRATDVRVAGACRRLLLVSPLHAGVPSAGCATCFCVSDTYVRDIHVCMYRYTHVWYYFVSFIFCIDISNNMIRSFFTSSSAFWHVRSSENTSEQLSSPRLCLWFVPASCTEQQQGRTITFGAQRGCVWWAVVLQLSRGAFLLSFH